MINPLHYDHMSYIAAAYGLFVAVTAWFVIGGNRRLAVATRRLRAAAPRTRAEP